MQLQVRVLGGVEVIRNGLAVDLGGPKQRALRPSWLRPTGAPSRWSG